MSDIQTQLPVKITDGTNTVAITGSALDVAGTVTANAGTGTFTVNVSNNPTITVGATSVTQPVSGTVTANAGTGVFEIAPNVGTTVTGSIVASNSTVTYNVSNALGAYVSVHGSYTGVAFNFQASDDSGVNYYLVSALRTDGSVAETASGTIANVARSWFVYFGAATNFQIAATAYSTGTANIRITPVAELVPWIPTSFSLTPTGTQTVAGTVTANAGTGTFTVSQASGSTITIGNNPTVTIGSTSVTQPVSGTVTANAGSGTFNVAFGEVSTGIVHNYQTSSALASGSSATLNYTVTSGKTLYLKAIQAASSGGPCKIWIQNNSGPTIYATGFYSAASPQLEITFPQPISFAATTVLGLVIQNNAGASQDVYGFINGHEV